MNLKAATFVACLCASSVANAEIYTLAYEATITSMTADKYGDPRAISTADLAGSTVSVGDAVTGRFTFDTSVVSSTWENDAVTGTSHDLEWSFLSMGDFRESGNNGSATVVDSSDSEQGVDGIWFYHRAYHYTPFYLTDTSLKFESTTETAFTNGQLTADMLRLLGNTHFSYHFQPIGGESVTIDANLASWTMTSAVPEPSTYVMLGVGLGLLAWRRKTAAIHA